MEEEPSLSVLLSLPLVDLAIPVTQRKIEREEGGREINKGHTFYVA
jgi:hypothetical protein